MENNGVRFSFVYIRMNKGLTDTNARKSAKKQRSHYLKTDMGISRTNVNGKTLAVRRRAFATFRTLIGLRAITRGDNKLKSTHLLSHTKTVKELRIEIRFRASGKAVLKVNF